jgi:uncharacterized protein YbbC (DUF1343 family)
MRTLRRPRWTPLALLGLALALPAAAAPQERGPAVSLGVDELLRARVDLIAGKRVGLVTNASGVDGALVPTADRLAADERFELVRLFGPEHGIRGDVAAGDEVGDSHDPVTGLAVVSLYGKTRRPPRESLEGLDVLLFDIQDVGARCYTYVSTLGEVMAAAAGAELPVIVLDRPNPLGGLAFEGPLCEPRFRSFIGWGPVPITHGLTVGEIARLYEAELGLGCDVTVVPMGGWKRSMVWEDTGLAWSQTSPHIPDPVNAHLYVGPALAASVTTNVNDGVGWTTPFEVLGAEFVEPRELAAALNASGLAGVRFTPIAYQPFYGKFEGRPLRGVRIRLEHPRRYRPVRAALTFLVTLRDLYPDQLELDSDERFGKHWGNLRVLEMLREGRGVAEIEASWTAELEAFGRAREGVLLYSE